MTQPICSLPNENKILEGYRKGLIPGEAVSYLQQAKDRASELLKTGPVLLGEIHQLRNTSVVLEQLITEGAVNRVVFELPPLEVQNDILGNLTIFTPARVKAVAEHASNFDKNNMDALAHKHASGRLMSVVSTVFGDTPKTNMVKTALSSRVNVDFIDGARKPEQKAAEAVPQRNHFMGESIKNDSRFTKPGVIGIFGAEHLRGRFGEPGLVHPTVQEIAGVSQNRVIDLAPVFTNEIDGTQYYPSRVEPENADGRPEISRQLPYRMKKQADQTSAGSPQWEAVAEKYSRHIVLNGAGSASKRQIDAISNKHPTITTVFDVSGDGVPTYNSGKGTGGYSGGTKVYVFNGSNKPVIETPRVIKHVDEMFDGFSRVSKLKEFHQSGNDFKKGAREKFEQYFLINAESGNAVADRAVQRLTAKHPEKTTVFVPDADGNMKVVTGMPKQGGGRTKFEVIGHGQEGKIGDLSPLQIVDAVGKISSTNNAMIEKLSLVGCESECKYNGILEEVKYLLIKSDRNNVKVKGYPTPIIINEFARKQPVAPGTPGALGNDDAQASGRSGKRTPPPLSPLRL